MLAYRIRITESMPPGVLKKHWRESIRSNLLDMGEHWHGVFLQRHFEPSAKFRYGHKRRSATYLEQKQKAADRGHVKEGGQVDNVASGLLRDLLMQSASIKATPKRATLRMRGPSYISMRPKPGGSQPHKAAEITNVLKSEERVLFRRFSDRVLADMRAARAPKSTNV